MRLGTMLHMWRRKIEGRKMPGMKIFRIEMNYMVFIKYCVFRKFEIYSGLWPFSVSPVSVCVHNGRSNTSAAAELAEFRKIITF